MTQGNQATLKMSTRQMCDVHDQVNWEEEGKYGQDVGREGERPCFPGRTGMCFQPRNKVVVLQETPATRKTNHILSHSCHFPELTHHSG